MEFGRIESYRDIKVISPEVPYAGLSSIDAYKWATKPANLSREYRNGNTVSASKFSGGVQLIEDVMREVDAMFVHDFSDYNHEYLQPNGFREQFRARLEDPGFLYHAIFFDVGNDIDAISFEWHAFHKRDDLCRGFIMGKSYDLAGIEQIVDKTGAWYLMNSIEGAIIGERKILTGSKPEGIDLVLNFDIENDSLRHMRMMKWPLFNQHREVYMTTHDAFERAEKIVRDLCMDGRSTGEIYSIEHAEIINAGIWGITNVRVYVKKGSIVYKPVHSAIH